MRPAIEYVREIPCDPRLSPVYRRPERRVASVMMVGLDLLPSNGQIYYIEANINPGFFMKRRWVTRPEGDPLLAVMMAEAHRERCDRIVMYASSVVAVSRELEDWWRTQTDAEGLGLEIRDDPRVRSPYRRNCDLLMDPDAEGVLYVNIRTLPHPANVLLEEKGLLEAEIERHNRRAPEGERIPVPRRILSPDDLPPPDPGGRFPNVVVKHALLNEARDVRMYRTSILSPEMIEPPHVAFEFVPPELEERCENGVAGEFATKYRVNLFIAPEGPVCASVSKGIGGTPVPPRLAEGRVLDPRPYVVNSHTGGRHERGTQADMERLAPAALRIGWLVHDFLRRKHGSLEDPSPLSD
jgi:hypothetical protein